MPNHATARTHTLVRRGGDVDEAAPSVSGECIGLICLLGLSLPPLP